MAKSTRRFTILLLFLSMASCSQTQNEGDRELQGKEIPSFLHQKTPNESGMSSVEYFKKIENGAITYEIKYEVKGKEISLTFDSAGTKIEEERDILFESLDKSLQEKIKEKLTQKYKKWRIMETEIRYDQNNKKLIDVEIVYTDEKSGFMEVTFNELGQYVSEKVENEEWLDTFN